jgi:hypothetical protein
MAMSLVPAHALGRVVLLAIKRIASFASARLHRDWRGLIAVNEQRQ